MASTSAARATQGFEVPAPGTWQLDQAHTTVEFVARHLMVAKVRGRFNEFSGTVHVDEAPERSRVEVEIDAASIDTGEPQRDDHLRSADFLDVANHPKLTFRSTKVELSGGSRLRVEGDLTIRGTTKPVVLDTTFEGLAEDPWGNPRAVFSARTEIDREAWGLTWNQALETGGVLVGKTVRIELEIEAVKSQG